MSGYRTPINWSTAWHKIYQNRDLLIVARHDAGIFKYYGYIDKRFGDQPLVESYDFKNTVDLLIQLADNQSQLLR